MECGIVQQEVLQLSCYVLETMQVNGDGRKLLTSHCLNCMSVPWNDLYLIESNKTFSV